MVEAIQGKRIAVLVEQNFEDVELTQPVEELRAAGATVEIVGPGNGEYTGKKGTVVREDLVAANVSAADYDGLVVPGGGAPEKMRMSPDMVRLVKEFNDQGKTIAAVCHGPQLLISADILRGRNATSTPTVAIDVQNAGANWYDEEVVEDGNLITSRKPDDLPAFDRTIIRQLQGERVQSVATGATTTYGDTES